MSSVNVDTGDRPWTTHAANVALKYLCSPKCFGESGRINVNFTENWSGRWEPTSEAWEAFSKIP
jgi:hypothetical protein